MNLTMSSLLTEKSIISEVITLSNSQNSSIHYIYIDIGCFNGETIEHFIHFMPNSSIYDIITFEPDPHNYKLCKQRLTQKKYTNINITILQKVVWIRDEKVFFRTNRGRYSRITTNKTGK
jgi:FkbM family methyltransferase